jgi:asparagine synthase (glutamine-hydrolysing)
MCGIVGRFAFDDHAPRVTHDQIAAMRDTLSHRGPDAAGLWLSRNNSVGFGFRRLAIVDLSDDAGQPMSNEDGTLCLVFNGEIYNHAEIRRELQRLGHRRWKTDHSDTEVILHAFEEWGISCIDRFRGMFAFAIWDENNRKLWLVRDRIGVKPLYYSIRNGSLIFASEIKALLRYPEQHRQINEQALFHYLSFLTTPAPHTLFEGIEKLPPATWLRVSESGNVEQRRYWDVWDYTQPLTKWSDQQIAEGLVAELRTAVNLRKVSDVPVGVFLSGGIDSSTNAALFSENESSPVKTFSIGYDADYGSYQNELHYARRMARQVGAEHHEMRLTEQHLLDFLPEMIYLQDEPIADPVCVPVYYVAKLAREHGVIVCQVGEGADELFWGYPRWKTLLQLQQYDDLPVPPSAKHLGLHLLNAAGLGETLPYELLRRGAARQPIFWGGAEALPHQLKTALLSPRLRRQFAGLTSWEVLAPIRRRFEERAWERSHLNWMSYLDLSLRLPELLLMRVDKMTMGVSLEGRVPFLDHKFVEFAMSIPQAVKTRGGVSKYILKKAVRGIIPDQLIDRRKQGFGVPVHEWFFSRLGAFAREQSNEFFEETDLLDRVAINKLLSHPNNKRGAGIQWVLLNLAMWWKTHINCTQSPVRVAV